VKRSAHGVFLITALLTAAAAGCIAWVLLPEGSSVRVIAAQRVHDRPRLVSNRQVPMTLERASFDGRGGRVRIQWYDGAWASRSANTGSYVQLVIDSRPVGATLFGGRLGAYEVQPGWLDWVGILNRGKHTVEVRVARADTGFALPQADPSAKVADNLFITEF
jgi:hypothetical protein